MKLPKPSVMPDQDAPQQIWIRRIPGGYDIRLDGRAGSLEEGWVGIQGTHYTVQMNALPGVSFYISSDAVVKESTGDQAAPLWQAARVSQSETRLGKEGEGWRFSSNGPIASNLKVQCRQEPSQQLAFELRAAHLKERLSRTYLRNSVCCFEFVGLLYGRDFREHLPALLYAIEFKAYGEAPSW